jgi:DNA-binding CsgD family transcriptional regulator
MLNGRPQAYLCISRGVAKGRFAPSGLRLLDALAPHLAFAVHMARVRRSLARSASGTGLIVLSDSGRVELANGAGERWLRQETRGGFGAWHMALPLVASLARRRQLDAALPLQTSIEVTHPALTGRYRLTAERMHSPDGDWRTGVLVEPVAPGDDTAKLRDLGLSAREAQVALRLIHGDGRHAIAVALACSEHTVGDHMRAIARKLGTDGRLGLVRALLGAASGP